MKLIKLNLIWSDLIQISFESELIWTDLNLIQTELIWIWTELNWIWIWIWIWSEPNRTDLNWIIYINIFRITPPILMLETWSYHHSNPLNETNLMVSRSLKSNHWMLRSTKLSSNFPSNLTPSILILQTWNTYHSNPLIETNLMVSRSLKSNH